jgi:hypothetical protein
MLNNGSRPVKAAAQLASRRWSGHRAGKESAGWIAKKSDTALTYEWHIRRLQNKLGPARGRRHHYSAPAMDALEKEKRIILVRRPRADRPRLIGVGVRRSKSARPSRPRSFASGLAAKSVSC